MLAWCDGVFLWFLVRPSGRGERILREIAFHGHGGAIMALRCVSENKISKSRSNAFLTMGDFVYVLSGSCCSCCVEWYVHVWTRARARLERVSSHLTNPAGLVVHQRKSLFGVLWPLVSECEVCHVLCQHHMRRLPMCFCVAVCCSDIFSLWARSLLRVKEINSSDCLFTHVFFCC